LAVVIGLAKWIAVIVGLMLVPQILYAAWVVVANHGQVPPMMEMLPPWWLFLGTAVPALWLVRHPWRADASGLGASPWRNLGWVLLPMASSQALSSIGYHFGAQREEMMVTLGEELARRPDWGLVVGLVLCAPLLEEAIFRGLAWRWLRPACGRWATIALSSLLFVGMHAGQYGAFGLGLVTVLALAFAAIRERTGSLLLCIAAHMLVNAVALAEAVAG
jgi:membrane protease YdiL (CAAX protease family)